VARKRPKYKPAAVTSDEDRELDDSGSSDESDFIVPSFDERKMGRKGEGFTKTDMAILARHLSRIPNSEHLSMHAKLKGFCEKVRRLVIDLRLQSINVCQYTERSQASWREWYRKNHKGMFSP
jgi:hypothetical protein